MALSKSNTYNRLNWEESDFPILCQTCLGDNPYIRMTKEKYGKECHICERPFTVFRWCPGTGMRYKKTEVCQTCAKLKNICQTCLLDLEYGLPTQVRDEALKIKDEIPKSIVNKEYFVQNKEKELADINTPLGKMQNPSEMLAKLARTAPFYQRNRPHICSFWVKGECKRGEECPYRHEKPSDPDNPLSHQNIRDRYYGVNDPVANSMLKRASELPRLQPPEDKSITTLYIGNLGDKVSESELRNYFYQFGEIRSVSMVNKQQCAFVQYTTRFAAENAAHQCHNKLVLAGRKLIIRWGKSYGQVVKPNMLNSKEINSLLPPVPGLPTALPIPPESFTNYFNLPIPDGRTNATMRQVDSSLSSGSFILPPPPPILEDVGLENNDLPPPPMLANFNKHDNKNPKKFKKSKHHYPSQDPSREGSDLFNV